MVFAYFRAMAKISLEKRRAIVQDLRSGQSQRNVSKFHNVSRQSVQEIFKKFNRTGDIMDMPRSGRPSKTTIGERRYLINLSKRNPHRTASELSTEWETSFSISIDTCKRILRKYGLFGRIAARKPYLNQVQIRKRLRWAKNYISWNANQWGNVIFTDECRFELFGKRRQYVRRDIKNRYRNELTLKTCKFGGKSLMVWGAIKYDGSRSLIRCDSTLNSIEYQKVLENGLLPIYNPTDILIQDNAPCHRSASTLEFLGCSGICYVEDWPPQSPDLNIIENLWADVKRNVHKRCPKTLEDLWKFFVEEWEAYPTEKIQRLYQSIPQRLKAVKTCKGQCTKY